MTPASILHELEKLAAHLAAIDVYRMNRELLKDYLLFMLSDEKAALLAQQSTEKQTGAIAGQLLKSAEYLPYYFAIPVLTRMRYTLPLNKELERLIDSRIKKTEREEKLRKSYPWLIVLITVLILFAMYFFSQPRK